MSRRQGPPIPTARQTTNPERQNIHRPWTTANVQPTARGQAPLIPPTRQGLNFAAIPQPTVNEWHLIPHLYEDRLDRRCFLYNHDLRTIALLVVYFDQVELYVADIRRASEHMVRYSYRIEEEAILTPREIRRDPLATLLSTSSRLRPRLEQNRNLAAPTNPFSYISIPELEAQRAPRQSRVVPFDIRTPRRVDQLLPPRAASSEEETDTAEEDPNVMRI